MTITANTTRTITMTTMALMSVQSWIRPDAESIREYNLHSHVIFVLSSGSSSQDIGLRNFLLPLRASSIPPDRLMPVVFYAAVNLIQTAWATIASFPKVYVYPRSENLPSDLRALNVHKCSVCLVMETNDLLTNIDDTLVDVNTIRTVMNIHSLFDVDCATAAANGRHSRIAVGCRRQGRASLDEVDRQQRNINRVQIVAELEYDGSVMFVDDDDDDDPSQPIYVSQPYVCGRVLLASVLDSLVTTAYVSTDLMRLFRRLIIGGEMMDSDIVGSTSFSDYRRTAMIDITSARCRSSLTSLSLDQPPLSDLQHGDEYGRLFVGCLRSHGLLCLGLYRLLERDFGTTDDVTSSSDHRRPQRQQRRVKRYVITNPPFSFRLRPTDMVYIVTPYGPGALQSANGLDSEIGQGRSSSSGTLTTLSSSSGAVTAV